MNHCLYAGPLTRYYTQDFQTHGARFAPRQELQRPYAYHDGAADWLSAAEVSALIAEFRARLAEKASAAYPNLTKWREDKPVYRAEPLPSECFKALLLLAAYHAHHDPALTARSLKRVATDQTSKEKPDTGPLHRLLVVLEAQLFLPANELVLISVEDPIGRQILVSTTGALQDALNTLGHCVWKGQAKPTAWFDRGPQIAPNSTDRARHTRLPWRKRWGKHQETAQPDSKMHNAEYAFGCFSEMLSFARTHQIPIRRDE